MPQTAALQSKVSFFGLDAPDLDALVASWGWPKYRAQQVRDWVYRKGVADPQQMTNLSKRDRDLLAERLAFATAVVTRSQRSSDGTLKLLLSWSPDESTGNEVSAETVMIPDGDRHTACVSSQVGCPVGCKFCASGLNGVKGNLSAAQIVEQVFALNREMSGGRSGGAEERRSGVAAAKDVSDKETSSAVKDEKNDLSLSTQYSVLSTSPPQLRTQHSALRTSISNIVFMGMGEPMSNYANVLKAIRILHDPNCYNLGARRITVSTVGVPAKMRQLAREDLPLNLAISLHAPNEPLRKQLIPWAEHFPLPEILDAARDYFEQTGREITLEYILLAGVNDQPEHARELAKLCKTLRANVNLIRYNEVEGLPFGRPKSEDVVKFQQILRAAGVNAHVRKSRGRDIDAACGQLRRKNQESPLVKVGVGGQ